MRKFYLTFSKGQAMPALLSWSRYIELLSLDNVNEINYYIKISKEQNLSYRELHNKIKSQEYKRLTEETKNKMISNKDEKFYISIEKGVTLWHQLMWSNYILVLKISKK